MTVRWTLEPVCNFIVLRSAKLSLLHRVLKAIHSYLQRRPDGLRISRHLLKFIYLFYVYRCFAIYKYMHVCMYAMCMPDY